MQIIRDADFNLEIVDWRDRTQEERAHLVAQRALADASRTFDLATDALFGATLVRLEEDTDHALLLVMHHIIVDATSIEMLLREFTILYEAYRLGLPSPLPEVPIQYADFAVWQRAWFSPARRAEQLAYWRNKLKDAPSSLGSLVPRPRPTNLSARAEWSSITLPKMLTSHVRAMAKELDATQFITLLAAFEVALSRLSGQSDLVASTSATHRKQIECEQLCGCFLHVVPFRADVSKARTFVDFVHQLQSGMLEALPYLDVTSGRLDATLFPLRNMKQDPLIQISFSSAPTLGLAGKLSDVVISDIDVPVQDFAKNDLAVFATETADSITLRARYKADLLAPETVARLLAEFEHVLEFVTADPHQQLHALGANP